MRAIANSKILIMATHGFEESELLKPLEELKAKGATVHVASPEAGEIKGRRHKDWGQSVPVDLTLWLLIEAGAVKDRELTSYMIVGEVEEGPHKRRFRRRFQQAVSGHRPVTFR